MHERDPTTELILSELRAIRDELNTYTRSFGERLSALETGMYDLRGNGQPGRMSKLEETVQSLDRLKAKALGIIVGVSGVVSVLAWCVAELLKH